MIYRIKTKNSHVYFDRSRNLLIDPANIHNRIDLAGRAQESFLFLFDRALSGLPKISAKEWADELKAINKAISEEGIRERVKILRAELNEWIPELGYDIIGKYCISREISEASEVTALLQPEPWALEDAPDLDKDTAPYVGASAFTRERAKDFFGRIQECHDLIDLLLSDRSKRRVVVVSAPSGAGKSSLLSAGLAPALEKAGWNVLFARIGGMLADSARAQNVYTAAALDSLGWVVRDEVLTWADHMTVVYRQFPRTILMIDQLEEIVTARHAGTTDEKRKFFSELLEALEKCPELRIVFAIREEYLPELVRRYAKELTGVWNPFSLETLDRQAAKLAIVGPLARRGFLIEDEVLTALLAVLAEERYYSAEDRSLKSAPGEFIEPIQLQVICTEIWQTVSPNKAKIDLANFTKQHAASSKGPPAEIIKSFAEDTLQRYFLAAVHEAAANTDYPPEFIRLCLGGFVIGSVRVPVPEDPSSGFVGHLPGELAAELVKEPYRLLRLQAGGPGTKWYELAHDSLAGIVGTCSDTVSDLQLQQLWTSAIKAIREPSGESWRFMHDCFVFLALENTAVPVPQRHFQNRPELIAALSSKRLIKAQSIKDPNGCSEDYWVLAHPRFASVLGMYRAAEEKMLRPLVNWYLTSFSALVTIAATTVVTAFTRGLLAQGYLTIAQSCHDHFGVGLFQGAMGGLSWGVPLGLWLSYRLVRFDVTASSPTMPDVFRETFYSSIVGLLGGAVVTYAILYGQRNASLSDAKWIPNEKSNPLAAFQQTGLGFSELLFGLTLGAACGFAIFQNFAAWKKSVGKVRAPRKPVQFLTNILTAYLFVLRHWSFLFGPGFIAVASGFYLFTKLFPKQDPDTLRKLIGESISVGCGGVAIVAGLFLSSTVLAWNSRPRL